MVEEGELGSGGIKVEDVEGSETVLAATTTRCCYLSVSRYRLDGCAVEKIPL